MFLQIIFSLWGNMSDLVHFFYFFFYSIFSEISGNSQKTQKMHNYIPLNPKIILKIFIDYIISLLNYLSSSFQEHKNYLSIYSAFPVRVEMIKSDLMLTNQKQGFI